MRFGYQVLAALPLSFILSTTLVAEKLYIALDPPSGSATVKLFDHNSGELLKAIPVLKRYSGSGYLAGHWLPNEEHSVVSIKKANKAYTAYVLNSNGDLIREIPLGEKIKGVASVDINGDGLNDIVWLQKNGRPSAYVSPGIGLVPAGIDSPKGKSVVPIHYSDYSSTGTVDRKKPSRKKKGKKKPFIQYYEAGKLQRIGLSKKAQKVLPLRVPGYDEAFLVVESKKLKVVTAQGQLASYPKGPSDQVSTGFFEGSDKSLIVVGIPDRQLTLIDPLQGAINLFTPNVLAEEDSDEEEEDQEEQDTTICDQYTSTMQALMIAIISQNMSEAARLRSILENMVVPSYCFGSVPNPGGPSVPSPQTEIKLVNHSVDLASDNGLGDNSMCQKMFSPTDGNNGFVWKPVSESNGKLVILTPRGFYASKAIFFRKRKKVGNADFAGYFHDGRPTYRASKSGSGYPRNLLVLFEMYDGSTRCTRIKNPGSRYD